MCSWTMLDHPKSVSWEMRKASIHKRLKKLCWCRCCFPARSRHKRTRQKNIIKYVDLSKQTSKQSSNSFQCKVDQECRIVSHRVATLHKLHHLIGRPLQLLLACTFIAWLGDSGLSIAALHLSKSRIATHWNIACIEKSSEAAI